MWHKKARFLVLGVWDLCMWLKDHFHFTTDYLMSSLHRTVNPHKLVISGSMWPWCFSVDCLLED